MTKHHLEGLYCCWRHQCPSPGCLQNPSKMSRSSVRSTAWSAVRHTVSLALVHVTASIRSQEV